MTAEHKIDRQKLISGHNPVLTEQDMMDVTGGHRGSQRTDNGSWNMKILIRYRVQALSAPLTRQ